MDDILDKIIDILKEMGYEQDKTAIIINPIENKQQAQNYLNWLQQHQEKLDYMDMIEIVEQM